MGMQNMPGKHRTVMTEGATVPSGGCNDEDNVYTVLVLLKDKEKRGQE